MILNNSKKVLKRIIRNKTQNFNTSSAINNNIQPQDAFLLKSRNIYNFPNINKIVKLDMNTISIHQSLLEYVNKVQSGERGSQTTKIINIKQEKKNLNVNIMDIYKFIMEADLINSIKEKFKNKIKKSDLQTLRIFFDGGCATNERLGFFGCVFYLEDENILKIAGNIGIDNTNNTAEYTGLIMSLLFLHLINLNKDCLKLKIYADSELVCRQMTGIYKTSTPHIIVLQSIAKNLFKKINLKEKEILHIYREYNEEADYVGNQGKVLENNSFEIYY